MISSACEDIAKFFFNLKYKVFAICIFKSLRLFDYCEKIFTLKKLTNFEILKLLNTIDPKKKKEILIGSGFAEKIKERLIISRRTNQGNCFKTLNTINNPIKMFSLLKENNVSIATSTLKKPTNSKWLIKSSESYGGKLVNFYKFDNQKLRKNFFFQKFIKGQTITAQFYTKKGKTKLLSICYQYLSGNLDNPFLLGGIITKKLNDDQIKAIERTIKKVSKIFHLNGFNNIDFILQENKITSLKLIEINPRPGLSTNIISKLSLNLFKKKNFEKTKFQNPLIIFSTSIIYSKKKVIFNKKKIEELKKILSIKNFSELPNINDIIKPWEPICLLHLKSKSEKIIQNKINQITKKIQSL